MYSRLWVWLGFLFSLSRYCERSSHIVSTSNYYAISIPSTFIFHSIPNFSLIIDLKIIFSDCFTFLFRQEASLWKHRSVIADQKARNSRRPRRKEGAANSRSSHDAASPCSRCLQCDQCVRCLWWRQNSVSLRIISIKIYVQVYELSKPKSFLQNHTSVRPFLSQSCKAIALTVSSYLHDPKADVVFAIDISIERTSERRALKWLILLGFIDKCSIPLL